MLKIVGTFQPSSIIFKMAGTSILKGGISLYPYLQQFMAMHTCSHWRLYDSTLQLVLMYRYCKLGQVWYQTNRGGARVAWAISVRSTAPPPHEATPNEMTLSTGVYGELPFWVPCSQPPPPSPSLPSLLPGLTAPSFWKVWLCPCKLVLQGFLFLFLFLFFFLIMFWNIHSFGNMLQKVT